MDILECSGGPLAEEESCHQLDMMPVLRLGLGVVYPQDSKVQHILQGIYEALSTQLLFEALTDNGYKDRLSIEGSSRLLLA